MRQIHPTQRGRRWLGFVTLAPLLALGLAALLAGCGGPQQQGQWELLGPNDGQQVESLTSDPHHPTLVYAAADDGKVYRLLADSTGDPSSGAGIPADTFISAVFADSHTTGRLYAGTSAGLYLSRDFGDTWARYGAGLPADVYTAFAESPNGATLLVATSAHGIYLSRDAGAHWQSSATGLPTAANVAALLWFPATTGAQTISAGLMGGGVYVSADGGATWTAAGSGLPANSDVNALAALTDSSIATPGPILFAGTGSGLYSSADGGKTWRQQGSGLPQAKILSLYSFPTYPGWIFAGTQQGVYLSRNGGHAWSLPASGLTQPVIAVIAAPSKHSSYVVFAASGQIARFPSAVSGGSPLSQIIPLILIVALLGLCFYFFYARQRRYSMLLARQERAGPQLDSEGGQRYVYVPLYGADAATRRAPDDALYDPEGAGYQERAADERGSLATSAKRLVSSTATNTRRKMRGVDKVAKSNKLPATPVGDASGANTANTTNTTNTANTANTTNTRNRNGKSSGGKRPNTGRRP